MTRKRRDSTRQRGIIVVWFALFMTSTLAFTALGVDVAKLATTKAELQQAADAAALAAAGAIDARTGHIDPAVAHLRARNAGLANEATVHGARPVAGAATDVQILPNNLVRVETRGEQAHAMVSSLAGVLGIERLEARAVAWARADTAGAMCRIVPIGIIPPRASATYQVGSGHVYRFRHGRSAGGHANYRPLLLPPCRDGDCPTDFANNETPGTFECLIRNDYQGCVGMKDWLFIQRADWGAALRRGLDDRWQADTDHRANIPYAQYRGNGRRILFMPVTTPEVAGDDGVWVEGLVAFFLHQPLGPGGSAEMVGEFIHAAVPGTPIVTGEGHPAFGPVTYHVHLVPGSSR